VPDGAPVITTRFSDLRSSGAAADLGVTNRITRHRGAFLVVDGAPVGLTHTPFAIGRGPGNDLVIASLSVSRRHAVIESRGGRFFMRDLNSRNGLKVAGQECRETELLPGVPIVLGEVEITLEREA
jgi:pSer/pThr/pTyr-binding forkhead associated (FHA) protein